MMNNAKEIIEKWIEEKGFSHEHKEQLQGKNLNTSDFLRILSENRGFRQPPTYKSIEELNNKNK